MKLANLGVYDKKKTNKGISSAIQRMRSTRWLMVEADAAVSVHSHSAAFTERCERKKMGDKHLHCVITVATAN